MYRLYIILARQFKPVNIKQNMDIFTRFHKIEKLDSDRADCWPADSCVLDWKSHRDQAYSCLRDWHLLT